MFPKIQRFSLVAHVVAAVLLNGVVGVTVRAQTPDPTAASFDSMTKASAAKLVRVVGPKVVTFDPQTKTVTVRLSNPTGDTVVVELGTRFGPLTIAPPLLADALLSEDSTAADSLRLDSLRTDSLGKVWSLESWIKEPLPTQIWLAPHQTVKVILHATVPPAIASGEYSAHLVVTTLIIQDLGFPPISFGGSVINWKPKVILHMPESVYPPSVVKMVYKTE